LSTHRHRVTVRFGDCDPAGVVYFPRFFDWFHQAMETWFGDALGVPYAEVIGQRKLGFPAVHTEADFRQPCRLGEELAVELQVTEVKRTSIRLAYTIRGWEDDSIRATGATVCVAVDLVPGSAQPLRTVAFPADLRSRIEAFATTSSRA
jgi:4-hydroxybenzoyl-CoA thioesterase